MTLEF